MVQVPTSPHRRVALAPVVDCVANIATESTLAQADLPAQAIAPGHERA